MKRLLILILIALPSIALGERPLTDIELRASYCVAVVKHRIEVLTQAVESVDTGQTASTPELRRLTAATIAKDNDRLQRLYSYLVPKAEILDLAALQIATNRGALDVKYSKEELTDICLQKCEGKQGDATYVPCFTACVQEDERNARMNRQCGDLSWLPF